MKVKKIDCVKMKHKAAELLYRQLKHLSPDKKRAYWSERFKKMQRLKMKVKQS